MVKTDSRGRLHDSRGRFISSKPVEERDYAEYSPAEYDAAERQQPPAAAAASATDTDGGTQPLYVKPTEVIVRNAPKRKINEFAVGPILNTKKGNKYAVVIESEIKYSDRVVKTYHTVIQDSMKITPSTRKLLNDRLKMNYGVEHITLRAVQTIDRATGKRVPKNKLPR